MSPGREAQGSISRPRAEQEPLQASEASLHVGLTRFPEMSLSPGSRKFISLLSPLIRVTSFRKTQMPTLCDQRGEFKGELSMQRERGNPGTAASHLGFPGQLEGQCGLVRKHFLQRAPRHPELSVAPQVLLGCPCQPCGLFLPLYSPHLAPRSLRLIPLFPGASCPL